MQQEKGKGDGWKGGLIGENISDMSLWNPLLSTVTSNTSIRTMDHLFSTEE